MIIIYLGFCVFVRLHFAVDFLLPESVQQIAW